MRKPPAGTEPPEALVVELGTSWKGWARRRSDADLQEINLRLPQLLAGFGKPHLHAGLGLRRLFKNAFEFRISRGIRVVFLYFKPNRLRLMMTGDHEEVRAWLKENV